MDKQKTMKLGMLAGAAVLSLAAGSAHAATNLCTGGTAGTVAVTAVTGNFIQQDFSMNCSANVVSSYTENATQVGVCSASNKGNAKYGGSTAGGAVQSSGSWTSAATISSSTTGC